MLWEMGMTKYIFQQLVAVRGEPSRARFMTEGAGMGNRKGKREKSVQMDREIRKRQ